MHHPATDKGAESDHTKSIQPTASPAVIQVPIKREPALMSTIWKISKNGSSFQRSLQSRSFSFHRSSSRFSVSGLIFPAPCTFNSCLASFVYFYGGYPFLKGIFRELRAHTPGMMTLIAVAISVAYFYSAAVVFGLQGEGFFWELATLIDIMLLGHWIEMKSVLGASRALEELVKIMPQEAHLSKIMKQ